MAYRNRYGITQIKPYTKFGHDRLDISFEADNGRSCERKDPLHWDPSLCKPVLLYIPDEKGHDHSHITLTIGQARKLNQWLGEFLHDVDNVKNAKHLSKLLQLQKEK